MEQEEERERERVVRVASLQGKNVSSCFHSKEEESVQLARVEVRCGVCSIPAYHHRMCATISTFQ